MQTETVTAYGMRVTFPRGSRLLSAIKNRGTYEPMVAATIRKNLKPGDHFLDVGAHVGLFTLVGAEVVGADGFVTAIEPDPECMGLLKHNVHQNRFSRTVDILPVALADENATVAPLYRNPKNDADCQLYPSDEFKQNESTPVTVRPLDDMQLARGNIDFIKMDIQGAEGWAIEGMRETIAAQERLGMVIEVWPQTLDVSGYGWERLVDRLVDLGFSFCVLRKQAAGRVGASGAADVKKFLSLLKPGRFVNLLCQRGKA